MAVQPRLRPFLTGAQLNEAASAATALPSLDDVARRGADASLSVLQDVVWLLPAEHASSDLRPC
eukprot:10929991-Alexandrium_andersonii.AAC.1